MSYTTWHNYGYGICVDQIKTQDVGRLKTLLKLAPELDQDIHTWLSESGITNPTWDDYMDYDQDFQLGLATILRNAIEEAEGLYLTACDDYDCISYLIYQPRYPWELSDKERGLTEERLDDILRRYINVLTDEVLEIGKQEVENGG